MKDKVDPLTKEYILAHVVQIPETGCWEWRGSLKSREYGRVHVRGHCTTAHRLAWEIWNSQTPAADLLIRHKCDNPPCANPDHLLIGTSKDNAQDCIARERNKKGFCKGHKHSTGKPRVRKLSHAAVKAIRRSTLPLADLSEKYGVSGSIISRIRRGHRKQLITNAVPLPKNLRGITLELHRLNELSAALDHLESLGILKPRPVESLTVPDYVS